MYRLLVVDDEDFITNSLAFMLESTPQFELDVYKAYSAFQALEYLNRFSFDIVVTDIQMPGMTGIELAEKIYSQWPSCQIIFLTCHDEFEYACKAIEYHAVRYVLKNEGDEVLLSAISECIDIIDREAHNSELLLKAEEQIRTYLPIMRQSLLQSYLETVPSIEEMKYEFNRLEIPLNPALPVMLLAARINPHLNGDKIAYINLGLDQKIGHIVNSQVVWTDSSCIIWIVQPKEERHYDYEQAKVIIKGMAENIQRMCLGTLNIKISFILDSAVTPWDKLAERFSILKYTVRQMLEKYPDVAIADIELFLGGMDDADCTDKPIFIKCKDTLEKLSLCVMLGDRIGINNHINTLSILFTQQKISELHSMHALELNYELNQILLSYITKNELQDLLSDDPMFRLFLTDTHPRLDYHRIEQFAELVKRMIQTGIQEQVKTNDLFVNHILQYIKDNIDADLSLYALSEMVYLNPSYLSRRFKEITGKNITEIVTEIRMMKACRLLAETNHKVNRIASMVGYESAAYFSRLFKQQIGVTPQKYRENLASQDAG